jgi:DNA (cytosine-5)-methyltransferase 1
VAELRSCGYVVKGQMMNSMYYGVPQSRERVIIVGVRQDLADLHGLAPSHPRPQTKPVTLGQACADIRALVLYPHGEYKGRIIDAATEPAPTLCKSGLPSYKYEVVRLGRLPPKPSELKTLRWAQTKRGKNHPERFSLSRLSWDSPSPTIQKTATGSSGCMVPDEPRELTELELKRIGSFPDNFQFVGKWSDVLARIGNSVPPLLMKAIALHIKEKVLGAAASSASLVPS